MPQGIGVRDAKQQTFQPKKQSRRPEAGPPQFTPKTTSAQDVKQELTRIFAEEWKNYYGTSYLPTAEDGKTLHFNVVPLVDTNGGYQDFLAEWRQAIHESLRVNMVWDSGDTDEAGRPTIAGVVNNYNDIRLLSSGEDGSRLFHSAYNKYRQIWGVDKMAAYRSAAKAIHVQGYRLSEIDPRLLKALKMRYSNRDLGLEHCPNEDSLRFTDREVEAEVDGNPELFQRLIRMSRSNTGTIRRRVIEAYKSAQSEGVVFDV